jgi:DegV family protein with EDD domain
MQIITDSAADLSPSDISTWGIKVVPLYIQFPDGEVSANEITPDDFYARLTAMIPQVPTTSQPAIGVFLQLFERAASEQADILAIHISSGLSGTHSAASTAARQLGYGGVQVVDTMTLSCGQRFQVLAAARAVKAGWDLARILDLLAAVRRETEVIYTLETLEYLARGGRIGRVQAIAGSLLKIKPIIRVDKSDGKYSTLGRSRTIRQSMESMASHFASIYGDKPVWLTVCHGQMREQASAFDAMLRERLNVAQSDLIQISPVLGVHTGPGILGAGVVTMEAFQGL